MSLVFGGAGKPLPKTLSKNDKFAWSKFEQPIGWPAGRKPWMVFVKAQDKGGMSGGFFFGYFLLAENCSCIFGIRHIHVVCQAKESISAVGPRPDIQKSSR